MSSNFSNTVVMTLCYESISGSCPRQVRPFSIRFPMYMFMVIAIIVTVLGNLLVIISIAHFKQLHTSTNYLLLSLAVCDLLLGGFIMPCSAIRSVEGCWYLGDFFCKIHTSTDIMLSTASVFHLSFISIDRYFAVCDPLRYRTKITPVVILIMIIISWVVPGVISFGMIFLGLNLKGIEDFYYGHCAGGCIVFLSEASVSSILTLFVPGLIMLGIYLKVYLVARKQAKSIHDVTQQFHTATGMSRQRERKAAKTLGIVMGVFLICWTPFIVCNSIDPFINYSAPPMLLDALVWFGYLNSAFNPIVYAFFYNWFRKALRIIMLGQIFKRDSSLSILFAD
ncbi:trace amine-associated receptor 1-like [Acipenser ruthenus]|uniref:trace amine-associated receptor 1-like n=1 Tax=Acipenser ruthenus TaxID=7906 RepID=UPI00145B3A26|nr:trace amine-associated receptor 1-like [Acipenser ruthenus]